MFSIIQKPGNTNKEQLGFILYLKLVPNQRKQIHGVKIKALLVNKGGNEHSSTLTRRMSRLKSFMESPLEIHVEL